MTNISQKLFCAITGRRETLLLKQGLTKEKKVRNDASSKGLTNAPITRTANILPVSMYAIFY
jgi:hypothetical protein